MTLDEIEQINPWLDSFLPAWLYGPLAEISIAVKRSTGHWVAPGIWLTAALLIGLVAFYGVYRRRVARIARP